MTGTMSFYNNPRRRELARQIHRLMATSIAEEKLGKFEKVTLSKEEVADLLVRTSLKDCYYDSVDKWMLDPKEDTLPQVEYSFHMSTGFSDGGMLAEYLSLSS